MPAVKAKTGRTAPPPCISFNVLFIGTGRAAQGLAGAFSAAGLPVAGLWSRGRKKIPGHTILGGPIAKAVAGADVIVLAVPDTAIAGTAARIAKGPGRLLTKIFVHLSGAHESGVLEPLRKKGALTASLHPFYSFVPGVAANVRSIPFSLEGAPEAVAIIRRIMEPFGMRFAVIDPKDKPLYHAAAVFCSNFTAGLQAVADAMLRDAGVGETDARLMVSALLTSTALNVVTKGPRDALTGPVVRGDLPTIKTHLETLSARAPHLVPPYAVMTLLLARTQGPQKLGKPFVAALHNLVSQYLGPQD
jgi:predicted short-subunit dehydrogenase-like oxidoreductase (DUF2520 family)